MSGDVPPERVAALREESKKVPKKLSSLPRLMVWAAGILWRSSPPLVVAWVASRVFPALQAGVLILVGRDALGSVVGGSGGGGLASPSVIAAAVFFALSAILGAIGVELQMQLSARVQKTTFDLLVDAASRVELEAYESPG